MSYIYECRNCGNSATFETDDINWICICHQKPKGVNTFFVCNECHFRDWGRFDSCPQCFANKLSEKKITVEYFGDMKNMPVRSRNQRLEQFEKHYEWQEKIDAQIRLAKIQKEQALLETPVILKQILSKLEKEPDEKKEDENDWVDFS